MTAPQDALFAEVKIIYRHKDGWHLFTSDGMDGLFVASPDRRKAFDDVPVAVRELLRLDHGIDCVAEWTLTYAGFVRAFRLEEQRDVLAERAETAVREFTDELMSGGIPVVIDPPSDQRLPA